MDSFDRTAQTANAAALAPVVQVAPDIMTTDDVAAYLGINKKTLDRMRGRGDGPRYLRVTNKIIRYRRSDIEAFLEERARNNTAQKWAA